MGQLARAKYGSRVVLIGLLTYSGSTTAASAWDEVAERKYVRPSLPGSYEYFFHQLNPGNFLIHLRNNELVQKLMPRELLERAIGAIYLPEKERISHYFQARLVSQYDVIIYLDKTTALHPLEATAAWHQGEIFETFPSGL